MESSSSRRLSALLVVALLASVLQLHAQNSPPPPLAPQTYSIAQPSAPPCDTCYHGARPYDPSSFEIGAVSNMKGNFALQHDSLHIQWIDIFKGPLTLSGVRDSTLWRDNPQYPNDRFSDSVNSLFWGSLITYDSTLRDPG